MNGQLLKLNRFSHESRHSSGQPDWSSSGLRGRIVELTGGPSSAVLTLAMDILRQCQERNEICVWVTLGESHFFPPDVHESGIDLSLLPVVRLPDPRSAVRAAERLARGGGTSLIVTDLSLSRKIPRISPAIESRLLGNVLHTRTIALFLTPSNRPAVFSTASLRLNSFYNLDDSHASLEWTITARSTKDKRRAPGWSITRGVHVPDGLY